MITKFSKTPKFTKRSKQYKLFQSTKANKFYKEAEEESLIDEELVDPQSIGEFLTMERYSPDGIKNILHIIVLKSQKQPNNSDEMIKFLLKYLSSFFQLKAELADSLCIKKVPKNRKDALICEREGSEDGHLVEKIIMRGEDHKMITKLNALECLGVLELYLRPTSFAVIGLTFEYLFEPGHPEDLILGRACGDRTCIISIPACSPNTLAPKLYILNPILHNNHTLTQSEKDDSLEFMRTIAHEVAHTLGIDHCVQYDCIMNPQMIAGSRGHLFQIDFCPNCLYKLWVAVGLDPPLRWRNLALLYRPYAKLAMKKWFKDRELVYLNDLREI